MGWSPDVFWSSTFYELSCAYIGHCRANGEGRWAKDANGWSQESLEEHREIIAELKNEFPDGKRRRKRKGADHGE